MSSANFLPVTYSIENRAGHWHMIIEEGGRKEAYPAASKVEAEMMIVLERNRRAGRKPS